MNQSDVNNLIEQLKGKGIGFDAGLSDTEVTAIQHRFDFVFPPDLRRFLQIALPVTSLPKGILPGYGDEPYHQPPPTPVYNWRSKDEALLWEMLDWPADGICGECYRAEESRRRPDADSRFRSSLYARCPLEGRQSRLIRLGSRHHLLWL